MVVHLMPYKILAYSLSDIGLVRQNNEDVSGEVPEINLYVLADGMGGHKAGEIAARQAVGAVCRIMKEKHVKGMSITDEYKLMRQSIEYANHFVYKLSRTNEDFQGMGTTICCLKFNDQGVVYAHVGDSRIYRLRKNQLEQITRDHSLLSDLLELGQLNESQAAEFAYKNIITKAIGTENSIDPSIYTADIEVGDIYLMCSDGLSDLLSQEEIETIVIRSDTVDAAAHSLVDEAKARGGHDNITVVIAKVQEST